MTGLHHTFKSALLKGLLLLCMIPAPAKAQLFGGMIKAQRPIAANITLSQNQIHYVASVYDEDYLPYSPSDSAASILPKAAGGGNETLIINVQGTITTSGVTVVIPVTATGPGILPAYVSSVTVPRELTQDDTSRELTLSWEGQAYTAATKTITATIAAVDGPLLVKKLDINAGTGNQYLGILLGQFVYPYKTNLTTTYSVRAMPGIPDKKFLQYDLGSATTYQHNFLYSPVTGKDGKVWLNNNLGADYSNMNKASFNFTKQANAFDDYNAYGSLFQFGRAPDGHELMNWTAATVGTPKYGYTTTLADTPTSAKYIMNNVQDWRVNSRTDLWISEGSANNPCPTGFRVPALDEIYSSLVAYGDAVAAACNPPLFIPISGRRNGVTGMEADAGDAAKDVWLWVADDPRDALPLVGVRNMLLTIDNVDGPMTNFQTSKDTGYAVRCLKD